MSFAIFLYHWMYCAGGVYRVLRVSVCVHLLVWLLFYSFNNHLLLRLQVNENLEGEEKMWMNCGKMYNFKNSDKTISHRRRNSTIFSFRYRFRFHLCGLFEFLLGWCKIQDLINRNSIINIFSFISNHFGSNDSRYTLKRKYFMQITPICNRILCK